MILWSKPQEVEKRFHEHIELVEEVLNTFKQALATYLTTDDIDRANQLAYEVHKLEGRADDVRRAVETELLSGALLASFRGDLLNVIEGTDKLANKAESILDFLLLQRVSVPQPLTSLALDITDLSLEIFTEVKEALHSLFRDMNEALSHTQKIEKLESQVDGLEREFIQELFKMDMELAEKILVREFVILLTDISDRAEDLSDQIEILVARRKV
ncbi:MAG: DUF47 domain-containing protein [Candidatus Bipolaricaulia bacterium]